MAITVAPSAGQERYGAPQTLVKISQRRRLNLLIAGEGAPPAIFAPGLNETNLSWARVQPAVALKTRTVAFDKAGMGFSDPGPLPRTASAVVEDLRAALKAADIAPPYVLAGHSAGGLYMRLFAFRHSENEAGMVMVDSSSEYQFSPMPSATKPPSGNCAGIFSAPIRAWLGWPARALSYLGRRTTSEQSARCRPRSPQRRGPPA